MCFKARMGSLAQLLIYVAILNSVQSYATSTVFLTQKNILTLNRIQNHFSKQYTFPHHTYQLLQFKKTNPLDTHLTATEYYTDSPSSKHVNYSLTDSWLAIIAGDLIQSGANTPPNYKLKGLIAYKPDLAKNMMVFAGSRVLYNSMANGDSNPQGFNMKSLGLLAGFTVSLN